MLHGNVEFAGPPLRVSRWRRLAMGSWGKPEDPSIYGVLELDAGPALKRIAGARVSDPSRRITITHFAGKAVAEAISMMPQLNSVLRYGRFYPRKTVDVCFQVANDSAGADLSGATIRDVPNLTIEAVAEALNEKAKKVRKENDPDFRGIKKIGLGIPGVLMSPLVRLLGVFLYTWNLWTPMLGLKRDAFGSVLVTNVGSLGLDFAFAALFYRPAHCPVIVALGEVKDSAVVENGVVVVKPILRMCVTFDHRFVDGVHAGLMAKRVRECFENPDGFFEDRDNRPSIETRSHSGSVQG